jgi:hypothetical protein
MSKNINASNYQRKYLGILLGGENTNNIWLLRFQNFINFTDGIAYKLILIK